MLGHPGRLEQPTGHADRRPQHRPQIVGADYPVDRDPHRARGSERGDPNRGGEAFAEPDRQPHHQSQRCKGGKPGQADVGFPAGRAGDQRNLGCAEMPEIVVGEAARRTEFAKYRIDRRHAEPRHRVDDRDLGMIEDRVRELHRVAVIFRQDRGRPAPAPKSPANTAATASIAGGMAGSVPASLCRTRSDNEKPAPRIQSAPIATTVIGDNPIQK